MVNQVKKSFYAVLLANDSYRVFKESYDNAMENYLDIKKKYEQGTVAEYDLIRADVTVKNSEPNMLQAENSLVLAKWRLKALMGNAPGAGDRLYRAISRFRIGPLPII